MILILMLVISEAGVPISPTAGLALASLPDLQPDLERERIIVL